MSWNSSNWHGTYWDRSYWWLGGSVAASGGGSDAFIIISTTNRATGLTFDPSTRIITFPGTILVSGSVYNPTTKIIALPESISVSGTTSNPLHRNIIPVSVSLVSALYINPTIKIAVIPESSYASGSSNSPTLSIGSTIFVGASIASARVLRTSFAASGGLFEDFVGSTEIISSEPGIRKGILKNAGSSLEIVVAGQSGLQDGDILIYLGNGQWRRRNR
jgi:hypothetical protein